jgi:hypothetical protein
VVFGTPKKQVEIGGHEDHIGSPVDVDYQDGYYTNYATPRRRTRSSTKSSPVKPKMPVKVSKVSKVSKESPKKGKSSRVKTKVAVKKDVEKTAISKAAKTRVPKKGQRKEQKKKLVEPQSDPDDLIEEDNAIEEKIISSEEGKIQISRLPTTSQRLTALDIVIHTLRGASNPRIREFHELNDEHLREILDLNMVNNHYAYQINDSKLDKQALRAEILGIRKEISSYNAQLGQLRNEYAEIRQLVMMKWKLKHKRTVNHRDGIMPKLNKLNQVLDPGWNLMDKLKALNEKLRAVDSSMSYN